MNYLRRKWLAAAGLLLGISAGSGQAQNPELPAPRNLPTLLPPVAAQPACGTGQTVSAGYGPANFCERCRDWCRHYFLGYAEEFEPVPLGYDVHLHMQEMVANGEAARMVLYDYDFRAGKLTLRGKDQLAKIAAMMGHNFSPIIIERTPANPALAEARRVAVLNELGTLPFPVPPERVVIGQPAAIGLSGREANLIYNNLLRQTQTQGINADPTLIQGSTVPTIGGTGGTTGGGTAAPPTAPPTGLPETP